MASHNEIPARRAVRGVVQRLESLVRSGLTHLPKPLTMTVPRKPSAATPAPVASPAPAPIAKRPAAAPPREAVAPAAAVPVAVPAGDRAQALRVMSEVVSHCTRCPHLAAIRTQTVFGSGDPHARLVFLGEAPGAEEDRQGLPFVGDAGRLLTDMVVKGMKLRREDCYILNVIKCRPPGNRTPTKDEADNCREYLDHQLEIIRPEFICCLGACASQNLLGTTASIGSMRGKVHAYRGAKVICTYHPAYLLRQPSAKRQTWEDLQLLMKEMGLPAS